MSQMSQIHAFCAAVGEKVLNWYGLDDGADLCFTLVETGQIDPTDGEDAAARTVAMHLDQA